MKGVPSARHVAPCTDTLGREPVRELWHSPGSRAAWPPLTAAGPARLSEDILSETR